MPTATSIIQDARNLYHKQLLESILTVSDTGVASNADSSSKLSKRIAKGITDILNTRVSEKAIGQTSGKAFEEINMLNLIRNRKGHLPHIVVITAEPLPSRIASIALGTGDIDCVYHSFLNELLESVKAAEAEDALEMLNIMIEGKRLKDISDLPFDLMV